MFITLLTHEREIAKATNTGSLVQRLLADTPGADCERVIWQRKAPCKALLERLANRPSALVYPGEGEQAPGERPPEHFVLIDATWQQARKIYNHSPYLQTLPRVTLTPERASRYTLRRNQVAGGLCTSECAAELMRLQGQTALARRLDEALEHKLAQVQAGV